MDVEAFLSTQLEPSAGWLTTINSSEKMSTNLHELSYHLVVSSGTTGNI